MPNSIMDLKDSIIFYSENNRSFSTKQVMTGNKRGMGSAWKLLWVPRKRNFDEYELQPNTDPKLCNKDLIQKWVDAHLK